MDFKGLRRSIVSPGWAPPWSVSTGVPKSVLNLFGLTLKGRPCIPRAGRKRSVPLGLDPAVRKAQSKVFRAHRTRSRQTSGGLVPPYFPGRSRPRLHFLRLRSRNPLLIHGGLYAVCRRSVVSSSTRLLGSPDRMVLAILIALNVDLFREADSITPTEIEIAALEATGLVVLLAAALVIFLWRGRHSRSMEAIGKEELN